MVWDDAIQKWSITLSDGEVTTYIMFGMGKREINYFQGFLTKKTTVLRDIYAS